MAAGVSPAVSLLHWSTPAATTTARPTTSEPLVHAIPTDRISRWYGHGYGHGNATYADWIPSFPFTPASNTSITTQLVILESASS
jgi:hypothetical protein